MTFSKLQHPSHCYIYPGAFNLHHLEFWEGGVPTLYPIVYGDNPSPTGYMERLYKGSYTPLLANSDMRLSTENNAVGVWHYDTRLEIKFGTYGFDWMFYNYLGGGTTHWFLYKGVIIATITTDTKTGFQTY